MAPRKSPRRVVGEVEKATKRDLARLPADLSESALAASAVALAREMDDDNSATSKSMCAKAHMEIMDRLRALAPAEEKRDGVDEIKQRRERRLAARSAAATNLPRT